MAEIENSKFKFYKNKILVGISDNDLQKVKQASETFSIYYKSKSYDKNLGTEVEMNPLESKDYYIYLNPYCRKDLFDGKLESLEQLIKPNLEFLTHRFTYTNTLKDFTNILHKGKFECIEQYEAKDIFEYIKKNNKSKSYNEVGEKYIGTGEAYSKLNYYPTSMELQYKLLPYMIPLIKKEDTLIKKSTLRFINNFNTSYQNKIYNELLKMGRYDLIDEVFKMRKLSYEYSAQRRLVIADLFAGEAEWLKVFKLYTTYSESYIVANEIEENRWKKCCEKKFQFKPTNLAYEELKETIPEKFINVLLFNPPYGVNSEGRRNTLVFLESLIKDNYLADDACVGFVINIDDFESCKHLLAKHFITIEESVNKLSEEDKENKLRQICFVGIKRERVATEGTYYYNQEMLKLNKIKYEEQDVDLSCRNLNFYYPPIEVYEKFDDLKFKYNRSMYNTTIDSPLWVNALNSLTIDTFTGKKIKLPDTPDNLGIVANLISSGLINGEIEGEHPHSIAAGITEKIVEEFDEESNSYIITKKQVPFCSILSGMQVINMTEEDVMDEEPEEIIAEDYYKEAS